MADYRLSDKALYQRDHQLDQVQLDYEALRATFPYLSRSRYVAGIGPETAVDAFVVLDMPNATEEIEQRAYSGQAGLITKQLLKLGGLEPSRCWLTYAIKFRLPRGRRARLTEMKAFRKPLQEEWNAVGRPRLVITVGLAALGTVIGELPDDRAHAQMIRYGKIDIAMMRHPRVGFGNVEVQEQIEHEWELLNEWRTG